MQLSTKTPSDTQKKFMGAYLRYAREKKGLSLEAVAQATGISKGTLWRYEKEQTIPDGFYLEALERFFRDDSGLRETETSERAAEPTAVSVAQPHFYYGQRLREIAMQMGKDPASVPMSYDYRDTALRFFITALDECMTLQDETAIEEMMDETIDWARQMRAKIKRRKTEDKAARSSSEPNASPTSGQEVAG